MMAMMMLRRGGGGGGGGVWQVASSLTRRRRRSLYSFSSSSSSPPSNVSPPIAAAAATAAHAAPAIIDSEEELLFPNPTHSGLNQTIPPLLQPNVVIYDGVCHLCHSGVKWLIKVDKDRMIKFCCLQSQAAEPYLRYCGVEREDVLRRFVFIEGPGLYHEASTAALKVASYLPLPYSALSALLIIPTPLRDAVYDYVAQHRYNWFGKENNCIVMKEQELLHRFIDREELLEKSRSGFS